MPRRRGRGLPPGQPPPPRTPPNFPARRTCARHLKGWSRRAGARVCRARRGGAQDPQLLPALPHGLGTRGANLNPPPAWTVSSVPPRWAPGQTPDHLERGCWPTVSLSCPRLLARSQPRPSRPSPLPGGPTQAGEALGGPQACSDAPAGAQPSAAQPTRPHLQAGVVAVERRRGLRAAVVPQLRVQQQVVLALIAPRAGPGRHPGRAVPPGSERRALGHGGHAGLAQVLLLGEAPRRGRERDAGTRRAGPGRTGAGRTRARRRGRTPRGLSSERGFAAGPGTGQPWGGPKGDLDLSASGQAELAGRRPGLPGRASTGGAAGGSGS